MMNKEVIMRKTLHAALPTRRLTAQGGNGGAMAFLCVQYAAHDALPNFDHNQGIEF